MRVHLSALLSGESASLKILRTLSVKDLKKIIKDGGLSDTDCMDKDSLIERAVMALPIASNSNASTSEDSTPREKSSAASPSSPPPSPPTFSSTSSSVDRSQEEKDAEMREKIRKLLFTDMEFMQSFTNPDVYPHFQKIMNNPSKGQVLFIFCCC